MKKYINIDIAAHNRNLDKELDSFESDTKPGAGKWFWPIVGFMLLIILIDMCYTNKVIQDVKGNKYKHATGFLFFPLEDFKGFADTTYQHNETDNTDLAIVEANLSLGLDVSKELGASEYGEPMLTSDIPLTRGNRRNIRAVNKETSIDVMDESKVEDPREKKKVEEYKAAKKRVEDKKKRESKKVYENRVIVHIEDKDRLAFINRFRKTAEQESEKYGIPAAIKLAQGILESRSGTSSLAVNDNNYFGVKCHEKSCSKGHCVKKKEGFFISYESAWQSFRGHSKRLYDNERYKPCFKINKANYKAWCKCLKKSGYAEDPNYADKLIYLIELYKLHTIDLGYFVEFKELK